MAHVPPEDRAALLSCVLDRAPFDPLHLVRMTKEGDLLSGITGVDVRGAHYAIDTDEALMRVPVRGRGTHASAGEMIVDVVTNDITLEAVIDGELTPTWGPRALITAERVAVALEASPIGPRRLDLLREIIGNLARIIRAAHRNDAPYVKEPRGLIPAR